MKKMRGKDTLENIRHKYVKNLKKAFKLAKNDVNLKKVCVVGDIYTTGQVAKKNVNREYGRDRAC